MDRNPMTPAERQRRRRARLRGEIAPWQPKPRTCPRRACGKLLPPTKNSRAIYCSDRCQRAAASLRTRRRRRAVRALLPRVCECRLCGARFMAPGSRGRIPLWCCPQHKDRAYNQRPEVRRRNIKRQRALREKGRKYELLMEMKA